MRPSFSHLEAAAALHISSCSGSNGWFQPLQPAAQSSCLHHLALMTSSDQVLQTCSREQSTCTQNIEQISSSPPQYWTVAFFSPWRGSVEQVRSRARCQHGVSQKSQFHSFREIQGDKATSWPWKCHTYGMTTRCYPQRYIWAGVCLNSSCLCDSLYSLSMSFFSSEVNGMSGIEFTEYIVSALILKLLFLSNYIFSFKFDFIDVILY